MANGIIDGDAVLFLTGPVDLPGFVVETIERFGFVGLGYRRVGKSGKEFPLQSVTECVNAGAAATVQINTKAKQGFIVDFTLDNGISYFDVMVLDVFNAPPRAIRNATGGLLAAGTQFFLQDTTWTMRFT